MAEDVSERPAPFVSFGSPKTAPVSPGVSPDVSPGVAPSFDGDPGFGVPKFGVYVHWPFCQSKCPYCDFNSHVRHRGVDEAAFVHAIGLELAHMAGRAPDRRVSSVFFGGGTPSLMRPRSVAAILEKIARLWTVEPDVEITLEANPSSVEADRFRGYAAAGVNRVSLGVQALNDRDLKALGRLHTAAEARAAIEIAATTFARYSFDLIYARPGQTLADWSAELADALAMAGDHLSLYQLTIEPDTPFAALHELGRLIVPDADQAADLYQATQAMMDAADMPAYEISNHARPGGESRHNLIYWRYGDYAGVGPGAHGRLTVDGRRIATSTERHPETWRDRVLSDGHALIEDEALDAVDAADEFLLMGLRLAEGIRPERYEALSGHRLDPARIADLEGHGLVETTEAGALRATSGGFLVLNAVVADLAA